MSVYEETIRRHMAANKVNLDGLIPRADFLADEGGIAAPMSDKPAVLASDLAPGQSFHSLLRKPDFQRETTDWTPDHIYNLVSAFLSGDLIPAVICWQSPSNLSFVIDGAHRLSAVMAWILNDYGDGVKSLEFYKSNIPDEQLRIARRTRNLIEKNIGSYKRVTAEADNQGSDPKITEYFRNMNAFGIQLQWLRSAEEKQAEQAFFTINQSAVKIDATELKILDTRFKPNAIIARAVIRNATGHKYWGSYSDDAIARIEQDAKGINELLFKPSLVTPIKTLELPVAGHGYGANSLPLIYEMVNLANGLPIEDPSQYKTGRKKKISGKKREENDESIDERKLPDESVLLRTLQNTKKLARKMTGMHASSLGLHPAVYFYSASGRHQPTAVLSMCAVVKELSDAGKLNDFCKIRSEFEEYLLQQKELINQVTRKTGSMAKGYKLLKEYFWFVLDRFIDGKKASEIIKDLNENEKFAFLKIEEIPEKSKSNEFSTGAKQHAFLEEALASAVTCKICGARKHSKSMTADHVLDKSKGGKGSSDNLQYVHPYCNSTFKDYKQKIAKESDAAPA